MSCYVSTATDQGGVQLNSGIPNRALYLTAIEVGGNSWEVAGNIWYRTLLDSRLSINARFQDFADLTADKNLQRPRYLSKTTVPTYLSPFKPASERIMNAVGEKFSMIP
jgi:Thermolysin metallopeptidase, alpha-helical domain